MKKFIKEFLMMFFVSLFGLGALVLKFLVFNTIEIFIKNEKQRLLIYSNILQKVWKFYIKLLKTFQIIAIKSNDTEKLQNIKNSIIVSTHPSFLDIVILISLIPQSTCFVAEKLTKNPFLKGIVKSLFISEGQPLDVWLAETQKMLDYGFNIIIFPMGTRHNKNEHPKIRRGASLIANKFKKNIVCINMETNYPFLQINHPIYETKEDIVVYSIDYIDEIDTEEFFEKHKDEVIFKTKLTRKITEILYGQ